MCKVDRHACVLGEEKVLCHLRALIVRERAFHLRVEAFEDGGEPLSRGQRPSIGKSNQGNKQSRPFHQSAYLRFTALSFDGISLPVAGNNTFTDFHRSFFYK